MKNTYAWFPRRGGIHKLHAIQGVCLTIPNEKCSLVVSHINSSCSIGGESVLIIWIKCVIGDSCPSVHVR